MPNKNRLKMIQAAQARLLRQKKLAPKAPKRESAAEEAREPLSEETSESPEYERREHGGSAPFKKSRAGSLSSSGAAVGGAGGGA